ncbi:glycoside hydrolase family 13 protein [Shewanella sp. AS16]|uniref:glycoside hydrolase family 13 protein n=1 Tax=Shewanella sp. AS16 TaxID=2907625 RepID=UPI001F47E134|nr:glycoside hydrolase family 13 protein [Shewanella sp. AS16]MCE9687223.1 glycoside hydrolase family 13 protein [Shewanella sp. AS16]
MKNKIATALWALSLLLLAPLSQASPREAIGVEPAFWWAGMHNPRLQLMLHGDKLAGLSVDIQGAGVKLLGTEHTDNPNYLFVNLDVADAAPQHLTLELKQADRVLHRLDYELKPRQPGSGARQGFGNKDVIYLITPDRFANGDPANDTVPGMLERAKRADKDGRHGGDISGIRQHLDYLAKLGVTQLWINPLLENNQGAYSYHGYSITDYYRIDPRFGSNQDYRALVQEAGKLGLGVINDMVVNHIGSGHWWLKDLPSQDWLNGYTQDTSSRTPKYTSHRRTTVQDPYAVAADKTAFTDGWFVDSMPDLNQRNPLLATYLIQNSIWWVEYAGLSGIREDTYSYADKDFLARWSRAVMDEYPNFNIVGEEWSANPVTVSYWQEGKHNADGYSSGLPSLMDFPLYEQLIAGLNESGGFIKLYEALGNDSVYAAPGKLVLFEGNHDTNRLFSLLKQDLARYKMAMTYVLTAKRIPQLFYGTEILLTSPGEGRNDGLVRGDFPGGWAGDAVNGFTAQGLSPQQREAQDFTRALLNYRKQAPALQGGALRHFVPENGTYVQFRCDDTDCAPGSHKLMIIYNKNQQQVELPLTRFRELIGRSRSAVDIIDHKHYPLTHAIPLSAAGVLVLELQD